MSDGAWRMPLRWQATWTQSAWVGVRLMIGYRALELGAEPFMLAVLAASFALPAVFAAFPAGRLSDRIGGSIVSFSGIALSTVGLAVAVLAEGMPVLVGASVIIGLGHLLAIVGQQTLVAHIARGRHPDGAFGTLTTAASIGQLIGPPIVTSIAAASADGSQARAGLIACLACTLLALPTLLVLRRLDPGGVPRSGAAPSLRSLSSNPAAVRALLVGAAVITTVDLLYSFLPIWGEAQDIPVWVVGALLALRALVSVASRLGLARLVARFGRRLLLGVALAVGIVALLALPFVGALGAVAVMLGLGVALGLPQPLTMSWIVGVTAADSHGAVLGARMTVNRLAQVSLPLLVGTAAAPIGVLGVFWATAAFLAGAFVVVATSDRGALPPGDGAAG